MSLDATKSLTLLVYQYGPFAFSIVFLYGISRWAYRRYDEAGKRTNPSASRQQIGTARGVYIASFTAGVVLVGISVWWFCTHRPMYVVTGTIHDLDHNMHVASTILFFRDHPHAQMSENDVPLHDVEFVALSEKPFQRGHKFPVEMIKNDAPRDQVQIEYDPDDSDNDFSPDFKDGKNILICNSRRTAHQQGVLQNWFSPVTVHAQEAVSPEQQTSQIAKPPKVKKPLVNGIPQQPNHNFASGPPPDPSIIDVLKDPHANVGSKITALDKLNNAPKTQLQSYLGANVDGEPFATTVVDLTRHSDPEVAYEAKSILQKLDLEHYLQRELTTQGPGRKDAETILNHLPPEQAEGLLRELPSGQAEKIKPKNLALAPTNFPDGDRYYMEVKWDPSDQRSMACLSSFFSSSLDAGQSPSQELETMRSKSQRLVYSLYKGWVEGAADEIRKCSGSVSFVRPARSKFAKKY